jgi:hypothetical protein
VSWTRTPFFGHPLVDDRARDLLEPIARNLQRTFGIDDDRRRIDAALQIRPPVAVSSSEASSSDSTAMRRARSSSMSRL